MENCPSYTWVNSGLGNYGYRDEAERADKVQTQVRGENSAMTVPIARHSSGSPGRTER